MPRSDLHRAGRFPHGRGDQRGRARPYRGVGRLTISGSPELSPRRGRKAVFGDSVLGGLSPHSLDSGGSYGSETDLR